MTHVRTASRFPLVASLVMCLLLPVAGAEARQLVKQVPPSRPEPAKPQEPQKTFSRGVPDHPKPAGSSSTRPTTTLSWRPFVGMDQQIFPSFIVSTATMKLPQEDEEAPDPRRLGEEIAFVGASLDGVPAGATIKVEVKPNAIMEASTFDGRAGDGAGAYQVYPKINYKYEALLVWRQPMPLNLSMEVFVNGRSLGVQTKTVTVRSVNDCPFLISDDDNDNEADMDLTWMFAAFVNENHPLVTTLTREAITSKIVDSFTAYQTGKKEEVLRQVYSIWDALQARGIRYSDISTSSAESKVVYSQHVRMLDESVTALQANCVDGTVLFASVLRKIGIEPYLVVVPGHMFLAFDLDEDGKTTYGLETTMIGDLTAKPDGKARLIPAALNTQFRNRASWQSFAAAIESGSADLLKEKDKFEGDDPDYQIVSVTAARQLGILPLAYRK